MARHRRQAPPHPNRPFYDRPSDSHRIALPVALSKRALGQKHQGPEFTLLFESALPEH